MPIRETPLTGMGTLRLIGTILDLADQQIRVLEHDLARSRETCDRLRLESARLTRTDNDVLLVASEEALEVKTEGLGRMLEERDALRAQLEQARKINENFQAEVADLQKKQERTAEKLGAAESNRISERKNAAKEKAAADSLLTENKKLYSDLDVARTELGALKQETSKAKRQLDSTILNLKEANQKAADRQAEVDSLRADLEETEVALSESRAKRETGESGSEALLTRMDLAATLISKALDTDDTDQMIKDLTRAHAFVDTSKKEPAA